MELIVTDNKEPACDECHLRYCNHVTMSFLENYCISVREHYVMFFLSHTTIVKM